MYLKDFVKLVPEGTTLHIKPSVYHQDCDPPFIDDSILEEHYIVGSGSLLPCAFYDVSHVGSCDIKQLCVGVIINV